MEARLIKELDVNFVNIPENERQKELASKVKDCLSQLYKGMEVYLLDLLLRENLTKDQLIEKYTVVEWVERSGLNTYFCMRVVKNEELEKCISEIQTIHYKTLLPFVEAPKEYVKWMN